MSKEIIINFHNAERENLITEGKHEVEVDRVELKQGKESGAEYLNWQFRIINGRHAGRCLFMKTSLQPEALWKIKDLFEAIKFPNFGKVSIHTDDLAGFRLFVSVRHKEFNGKIVEEISRFRACE